ncbi:MAG TPA: SDR family oxidoreductase [Kiritimatiellia bacterium]|nr:SDR family oxidoreductase [Kiritimatiellia bacterium]HMO98762.1 SDR family oxidoreductase [Kiritimatiellia bacterium]
MYLVTGGAGFIGSNMVHRLLAAGEKVRILDNFATGRRENLAGTEGRADVIEGDLRDRQAVARAVAGVRYVLHFGALPSVIRSVEDPWSANEVNIDGTLNLLLAARDAGVERLVFSSSSSVYGDTPVLPKHEGMTPNPLSPYAAQKLNGEHYCRIFHQLYGLKTYALRYFNVFGPRQNPKSHYAAVIPLFIQACLEDRAPVIHGDGGQTRDFTFVEDILSANLACCHAAESAAGGVYNVAWGNRISIKELALTIAGILGKDIAPIHEPARAGDVRDSQADSTRAQEALGWTPQITFTEGLSRTIDWYRRPS